MILVIDCRTEGRTVSLEAMIRAVAFGANRADHDQVDLTIVTSGREPGVLPTDATCRKDLDATLDLVVGSGRESTVAAALRRARSHALWDLDVRSELAVLLAGWPEDLPQLSAEVLAARRDGHIVSMAASAEMQPALQTALPGVEVRPVSPPEWLYAADVSRFSGTKAAVGPAAS